MNLTVIKSGVADLTGLGEGDGGADFSEVSLSYVKSPGSIRSKSAEGVAALASWCAGGGRSDVMPGTSSLREGAPTSYRPPSPWTSRSTARPLTAALEVTGPPAR